MKLVREKLRPLIQQTNSAHAGLLTQKALLEWEEGEKPQKNALIQKISSIQPDDIYTLAFERWLLLTNDKKNTRFVSTTATIDGRLMAGLPLGGTLETGVSTHHSYGMPLLAGSSIKGVVRHFAESIDLEQPIIDVLFGKDADDGSSNDAKTNGANAGYLIWHDAWWIPDTNTVTRPFCKDIVTVHHQKYYKGEEKQANDTESPTPNLQIAVQGSFYFVIEALHKGMHEWAEYAKALLECTLQEQGLGAKTSSGYGYFRLDNSLLDKKIKQLIEERKQEIEDFETAINNVGKTAQEIFIDNFKNKKIPEVFEFYKEVVEWEEANKKDVLQAYQLIIAEKSVKRDKNGKWINRLEKLREKLKDFGYDIS